MVIGGKKLFMSYVLANIFFNETANMWAVARKKLSTCGSLFFC